jgi:hypothetical protein
MRLARELFEVTSNELGRLVGLPRDHIGRRGDVRTASEDETSIVTRR